MKYLPGIIITIVVAIIAKLISDIIPVGGGVFALLIGMAVNPLLKKFNFFQTGIKFVSKQVLRIAIILLGFSLSISQIFQVGKYSLIVMCFTLLAAFGGGYLLGKLLKMNWKLSGLISAGTGICGGSAIAAIAPVIEAEDKDVAYAISATFLFDVLMIILFPLAGKFLGMSDAGYGLWTGTAVNDTASVVAAGYAFSDAAGAFSVIVKLTRTLAIIPTVIAFSFVNQRTNKINFRKIFPYFILFFLGAVLIKSTGVIPDNVSSIITQVSKFLMIMALGAIGLKTNFKEVALSGVKPMFHGFIISSLVVLVSLAVQLLFGQL